MKLSLCFWRNAYTPESKIRFKAVTNINNKLTLHGAGTKEKLKGCLHEFTLLMGCLEKHSYDNTLCKEMSNNFTECFRLYGEQLKAQKKANKASLDPYSKSYSTIQMNKFLNRFK